MVYPAALKLAKMDGPLAKSDPFFEIIGRPKGYKDDYFIALNLLKKI